VAIGGKPAGRLTVGLFERDESATMATFKALVRGTLRGRGGSTVGYKYSTVWRERKGDRLDFWRVVQIDTLNQLPGTPQRAEVGVEVPLNNDANALKEAPGSVAGPSGGEAFEWRVNVGGAPAAAAAAEGEPDVLVFGRILDGWDVVEAAEGVAVNQKTMRDGFKKFGRAIEDSKAKAGTSMGGGGRLAHLCAPSSTRRPECPRWSSPPTGRPPRRRSQPPTTRPCQRWSSPPTGRPPRRKSRPPTTHPCPRWSSPPTPSPCVPAR